MQTYDVIIVGGGPAGLRCAEELSATDKRVLLLEQHTEFGDKLCAGGLTPNDMHVLDLPMKYVERSIRRTALHSGKNVSRNRASAPFLFMVDRKRFGAWQRARIRGSNVEIHTGTRVVNIENERIQLQDGRLVGYRKLVGADGSRSVVRKHLELPVKKRLMGLQCALPLKDKDPALEVHLRAEYFHAWYGWIFPHRQHMLVGCCSDPGVYPASKLKEGFIQWLSEIGLYSPNLKVDAWPINCDYRGMHFGNVYLAGDAAGLASGLTGEGIYQSLVSGSVVANMILDPTYRSDAMPSVLRYNKMLERIKQVYLKAGMLRGQAQELTVWLMQHHRFRHMLVRAFT